LKVKKEMRESDCGKGERKKQECNARGGTRQKRKLDRVNGLQAYRTGPSWQKHGGLERELTGSGGAELDTDTTRVENEEKPLNRKTGAGSAYQKGIDVELGKGPICLVLSKETQR